MPLDAEIESRTGELNALGFHPLDALHVAFAERAGARWFAAERHRASGRFSSDEARDDGVNEKRVAAVDEEVELVRRVDS